MRDAPFWLARNASDLLWMEDDCTRRQEGHESGVAAWERIFGDARPIEAQEHYDGGDCDFYLFADGRIYLHACDADEIRFLRVEADDPALRGYECAGNSASLRCHWVGEVPRRTKHYDAPMCPQCASASAYPRRMIYGGKFPAFANWAPSLPASPAEPPARVVLIDLAHSSDMQIKARLHAKAQAAAQLTEGLDQVLRTFAAPPAEAERLGLAVRGKRAPYGPRKSLLKRDRIILRRVRAGESYRAIARDYAPLTFQAIGCIVRRHKPKKP